MIIVIVRSVKSYTDGSKLDITFLNHIFPVYNMKVFWEYEPGTLVSAGIRSRILHAKNLFAARKITCHVYHQII
jgi:hypothetical protein